MERTIDGLLEEMSRLPEQLPGISGDYVSELQCYLAALKVSHPSPEAQKEYQGWYGSRVSKALHRAIASGEVSPSAFAQIGQVMRLIDERHGLITGFPIIERPVRNCIIRDGKVYRPEIVLPNNQRISLYEE